MEDVKRDVVHRMNVGFSNVGALKSVMSNRKDQFEMYILRSNCTNGIAQCSGMGYEKC